MHVLSGGSYQLECLHHTRCIFHRKRTSLSENMDEERASHFAHGDTHTQIVRHPHAQMIGPMTSLQMRNTASALGGASHPYARPRRASRRKVSDDGACTTPVFP